MTFGGVFLLALVLGTLGGASGVGIRTRRRLDVASGVAANERISAVGGAVLLLLALGIGITILQIRDLLPEHYLIGFLMLGPLGLKLSSTGYRFVRYYTHSQPYRRAGPPELVMRLSAPFLVVATIAVFATGIELWLFGYRYGTWWFQAHVVSFLAWTAFLAVHLLGYAQRSFSAGWEEVTARLNASITRRGLVVGALLLGVILAIASLLYTSPFPLPAASG